MIRRIGKRKYSIYGYDGIKYTVYIELRERNLTSIDNIIQNTYNMVKGYVDGI